MIRFTWHQFRVLAALALGAMAIVAIVLAITGPNLAHLYDANVATCKANNDCSTATAAFLNTDNLLQVGLGYLALLVPGLIGIFWGAPLIARELEAGTYRLAWTQSVTRARWLVTKIALVGLASMGLGALLSLMTTWWFRPIDLVNTNSFTPPVFDERGIVPIGYAAFAFALGVTAGVLIRRTLPAMAATLVVFAGARLGMTLWVRPHLIAPGFTSVPVTSAPDLGFGPGPAGITFVVGGNPSIPNAWVLSSQLVDNTGRAPSDASLHQFIQTACPSIVGPPQPSGALSHVPANPSAFQDCLAQLSANFHEAVTYQPAVRYWAFQWYETAIFVGLAVVLAGFCFWWIRRHLA